MPGQGSSTFGIFPDMEEREHMILEVGIPLFQLVYPKPIFFDEQIHNIFGVRVDSPDPDIRNAQHHVEWFTGGDAHVSFQPRNKNGLGIAWVPDDPWMHNRVIFLTNENIANMVKQLRRPNGDMVSAAEIKFELKCMDTVLRQPTKIWNVAKNGNNICWFKTKEEAQQYTDDQGSTEVKLDPKTGTLQPLKVNKAQFTVVEGERWAWKPEVESMIEREKNKYRFGWTECKDFENKCKPMILKNIREQREDFIMKTENIDAKDAVSAIDINNLSDDAIDALTKRMNARRFAKKNPGAGNAQTHEPEEEIAK